MVGIKEKIGKNLDMIEESWVTHRVNSMLPI